MTLNEFNNVSPIQHLPPPYDLSMPDINNLRIMNIRVAGWFYKAVFVYELLILIQYGAQNTADILGFQDFVVFWHHAVSFRVP
jgi:hypothetical protein